MNIFVAGASGFLGSHVAEWLKDAGHIVRKGFFKLKGQDIKAFVSNRDYDYFYGDLTILNNCRLGCRGMDVVVMCAAVTSGARDIVNNPMVHFVDNEVMNTYMLNAAWQEGVKRFIFISSSTIYPNMVQHMGLPINEHNAFVGSPVSCYRWVGNMKRSAELQGWLYATTEATERGKMQFCALRPGNIYGPGDKFGENGHMVAAMIRKIVDRQHPLEVWGDGEDIRDHIYVGDVARAVRSAVDEESDYSAYNIATGQAKSVKQVIETIAKIEGYWPVVVFNPGMPSTIRERRLEVSLAERRLGFKAEYSLEDGLRETIAWYKENKGAINA